jgi:Immunity protein 26
MQKKPIKPKEGNVVSMKLDDGRSALGVLARVDTAHPRKPYLIFVYFFGPYDHLTSINNILQSLSPATAVCRLRTSALDIYSGEWQTVGTIPNWNRADWPFPNFYIKNYFSNKLWRCVINEENLAGIIRQEPIDQIGDLKEFVSSGSEAARITASMLLEDVPTVVISIN